jgi:hypothetical protein
MTIPLFYAVTRWAWALGLPLGISEEFLREGQEVGLWWAGAALATLAAGGAVLTLGLVQRWGKVFPRWLPFVGGRRVPVPLAVVPASLVSVLVPDQGGPLAAYAFGAKGTGPVGWVPAPLSRGGSNARGRHLPDRSPPAQARGRRVD